MTNNYVLADSSFFILFLNDINNRSALNRIINKYKFIITPHIQNEITSKYNNNKLWLNNKIKNNNIIIQPTDDNNLAIFEPLISRKEKLDKHGEYELIAIAYKLKEESKYDFYLIIDDKDARKIANQLSLESYLIHTLEFIKVCYCDTRIFTKNEAIKILEDIRNSKFRVKDHILYNIMNDIQQW